MTGVVCDGGKDLALQYLVNKTAPQNLVLKLFQNNHTPALGDAVGAYTEATFTGYSSVTLTGASWTEASGVASYAQQTFTSSANQSAQTIYGAYLVRATGGELIAAELFGTSATIANNGDTVKVTPSLTVSTY